MKSASSGMNPHSRHTAYMALRVREAGTVSPTSTWRPGQKACRFSKRRRRSWPVCMSTSTYQSPIRRWERTRAYVSVNMAQ